jgi:siroheme synthase-like protein
VAEAARAHGTLVYVQDRPTLSDLSMPALARRGPLQLAVSTEGLAPALARRLRQELEKLLLTAGQRLDDLLDEMARARDGGERNQLTRLAERLRIAGRIEIDP